MFEPDKITKEHILRAVEKIEMEKITLIPSKKYSVIINGKKYPPKEVMRYAHEQMNTEYTWEKNGGISTNMYLKKYGFEIEERNTNKTEYTGYWMLICNPRTWKVDEFLKSGETTGTWKVTKWQRDHFRPGQKAVIRVGQDKRNKEELSGKSKLKSGIYAIVEIKSIAKPIPGFDNNNLWSNVDENASKQPRVEIEIKQNLLENPITIEYLKENEITSNDKIMIDGREGSTWPIPKNTFDEITRLSNNNAKKNNTPLNQILYGPPGTGKTYNTINKSIAIIDNLNENDLSEHFKTRQELKNRFDELLIDDWEDPKGQIGFTTFHQSLSYEDFIEGIKPVISNEQEVLYDVIPGIFKTICGLARDNFLSFQQKSTKNTLSFDEVFLRLKDEWEENPTIKFPLKTEGKDFTILGFSKHSIQFKKASGGTGHTFSISTLREYYYGIREIKQGGLGIYYPSLIAKLKSYKSEPIEKKLLNYILIIDEINRGNVSSIFGELITLIEESKRQGNDEMLEVVLPYSKEKFSVPPNIHIIGTMNTADRSVEALDTALRRRFTFTEMPPQPELIETEGFCKGKLAIDGNTINLRELLEVINQRIEILLDKDHLIGHSFFMNVKTIEDLKQAFSKQIIPLLQEYFYGDYGKISLVLGEGFCKGKPAEKSNIFAKASHYESDDYSEKIIYKINDPMLMDDESKENTTFYNAIQTLLNKG